MEEAKLYNVHYTSKSGETSDRTIIPTFVPAVTTNVKAIDVSHLSADEREELRQLLEQYSEYKQNYIAGMFKLETWLEHTTGKQFELKFRTFVQENLQIGE